MKVLVIIPAFNEQQALGPLLLEARGAFATIEQDGAHRLELLVVDDGSRDDTQRVARDGGARVVRLPVNLGIGGAVQSGLRVAFREGFDCAVQLDGDGQHPPGELAVLLGSMAAADAPDLLIGSRFLERKAGADSGFRSTFTRRVGIAWLRFVLALVGARVTDPTSGYRVYGRRAIALFDETYPYDFPEPEAVAVAQAAGLVMREAPVTMRERLGGQSSIVGLSAAYYMVKVTVAVLLAYVRNRARRVESRE